MTDKIPHKHAELFRELAEDGEAWRNWQWQDRFGNWLLMTSDYGYHAECNFRRKPTPKEYILIGDVRVPAPCREPLEVGTSYFAALSRDIEAARWDGIEIERGWLKYGRIHLTREAAQAHVDAEKKVNTTVMTEE